MVSEHACELITTNECEPGWLSRVNFSLRCRSLGLIFHRDRLHWDLDGCTQGRLPICC